MYSIEYNDIVIACIGLGVYISGKLWMYYNHTGESNTKNKGVIKRGPEWEND
jgi:hypothetical protein